MSKKVIKVKKSDRPAQKPVSSFLDDYGWGMLAALATLLVYWKGFFLGFTNWDDEGYVLKNALVLSDGILWKDIFSVPIQGNYHPLTILSLKFDHLLFGLNPQGYHAINILLHTINTLLVYLLTRRLNFTTFVAISTALIFGLHPMHVESVAWISERKDVLYVMFFLGALLSYLRYRKQDSTWNYVVVLLFFLASILAKAMAVVLPIVLMLVDIYLDKTWDWKKSLFNKIPLLIISVVLGTIAMKVQAQAGAISTSEVISLGQRIIFAGYGMIIYIIKLLYPFPLVSIYNYPDLTKSIPLSYYLYFIAFLSLMFAWLMSYRHHKVFFLVIGFYLSTVVLVSQIIAVGQAIMADRYSYLPYVSLGLGLALVFEWTKKIQTYLPQALMLFFTLMMVILTIPQINTWQDSDTLWSHQIKHYPGKSHTAYKNRGNFRAQNGQLDAGLMDIQTGLKIKPNDAELYESLGNIHGLMQKPAEALAYYTKAIELEPTKYSYYLNRGITNSMLKNFDQAIQDYNTAVTQGAPLSEVIVNRAFTYLSAGKTEEAITDYRQILATMPNDPNHHYNLGSVYFNAGRYAEAKPYFDQARALGFQNLADAVKQYYSYN